MFRVHYGFWWGGMTLKLILKVCEILCALNILCEARGYDASAFWRNVNAVNPSRTIPAIECPCQGSLLTE